MCGLLDLTIYYNKLEKLITKSLRLRIKYNEKRCKAKNDHMHVSKPKKATLISYYYCWVSNEASSTSYRIVFVKCVWSTALIVPDDCSIDIKTSESISEPFFVSQAPESRHQQRDPRTRLHPDYQIRLPKSNHHWQQKAKTKLHHPAT